MSIYYACGVMIIDEIMVVEFSFFFFFFLYVRAYLGINSMKLKQMA